MSPLAASVATTIYSSGFVCDKFGIISFVINLLGDEVKGQLHFLIGAIFFIASKNQIYDPGDMARCVYVSIYWLDPLSCVLW